MKPLREFSTEQIEELGDDEIIEFVADEIQSSRASGGDLEEEHVALAPWLEEAIRALWRGEKARRIAQARRSEPVVAFRRYDNIGSSFFGPAPQPAAENATNATSGNPRAEVIRRNFHKLVSALPIVSARTKPEEEPAKEEPAREEPGEEEQWVWTTANRSGAQLSRITPLDTAKLFTKDRLELSAKGKPSLSGTYFYRDDWWQWNGAFYEKAPEQRIIDLAVDFLDNAKIKSEEGSSIRFKPNTKDLSSLTTFLRSHVGLDDRTAPPKWLDERSSPRPDGLLAFRNCLVDATTGKTYRHEPGLWLHDGVDFDFDPEARCPTWEWFLKELFPKDDEARDTIEEQLGYGMTIDNQFEKAAFWKGPERSGRGTLARIQELLVGHNGHCSLNIHTWHNNENSRMGMIGKRVGIFHDIRLKPAKQYGNVSYDPGGVDPQSQQLLLELISGDLTEIGKKYLEAWKGLPFIKFILISNKLLNFNDPVLITRFIFLEFKESWLGREDPRLKKVILPSELPGIANRCLAAYRRLLDRGWFIQPACGLALLGRVKAQINPYAAFMDTYWDPDPKGEGTQCGVFMKIFRYWCMETETYEIAATSKSNLIQKVNELPKWTWLHSFRPSGAEHARQRRYHVKLKPNSPQLPADVLIEEVCDE